MDQEKSENTQGKINYGKFLNQPAGCYKIQTAIWKGRNKNI